MIEVQKNFNVNLLHIKSENGHSLLCIAAGHGYTDIVSYLVEQGADIPLSLSPRPPPFYFLCESSCRAANLIFHPYPTLRSILPSSPAFSLLLLNYRSTGANIFLSPPPQFLLITVLQVNKADLFPLPAFPPFSLPFSLLSR